MTGGRAVWTGAIALGMATVPVKAYIAASAKDLPMHMLHEHEGGEPSRVKQRLVCEAEGVEVDRRDTVRGYAVGKDELVVLTDDDFAQARGAGPNDILEITSFAHASEVPELYLAEPFALGAEDVGRRGLALLLQLLTDRHLVAVGKLVLRNRQHVCVLKPMGGTLLLWTLHYDHEVRVEPGMPMPEANLSEAELAMAGALVDMLQRPFALHEYRDEYRAGIEELVEAKLAGRSLEVAAAPAARPPRDLMEALRESVAARQPKKARAKRARKAKAAA